MRDFVYTVTLFESILFFSIFSILGIDYGGADSGSMLYYAATAVFFVLTFVCIFTDPKKTWKVNWAGCITLLVLAIFIVSALISGKLNTTMFKCFSILCVPVSMIAIHKGNQGGDLQWLTRWLDLVLCTISIALLFSLPRLLKAMVTGDTYYSQTLSYYAAMTFALNLFILACGKYMKNRPKICRTTLYLIFQIILLPIPVVCIMFSGGRGGFVVVAMALLVFLFTVKINFRKVFKYIFWGGLICLLVALVFFRNASADLLKVLLRNMSRLFSYISASGIDMSETSGRDALYLRSLRLIWERPIVGYGLFRYPDVLVTQPYPHNLFLEWLLQGGAIYFVLACTVLVLVIRKYIWMIRHREDMIFLMPLAVYSLTELMFSATYLQHPQFWFFIVYVLCFNTKKVTDVIMKEQTIETVSDGKE